MSFLGFGNPEWKDLMELHAKFTTKYGSPFTVQKLDHGAIVLMKNMLKAAVYLYSNRSLGAEDEKFLEKLIDRIKELGVTA